jgi:phosphate uptake regulator
MLRKIIHATLIMLLMTESVSAQIKPGVTLKNDKPSRSKEQQEYDKAIDREYQSAIKKVPDQKKSDPWGDIRTAPATKNKQ